MREYGETWTDYLGREWPVVRSRRNLKFSFPSHAALRAHIFHRDGYACVRCPARATHVPLDYSGRFTLATNTRTGTGTVDVLILDHVLTRRAGGLNHPSNFQTLCETCNRRKQREDKAATAEFLMRAA